MSVNLAVAVRHGDAPLGAHGFQIRVLNQPAFGQEDGAVGNRFHFLHEMGGQEQQLVRRGMIQDAGADFVPGQEIDAVEGLIQHIDPGVPGQGDGDLQLRHHAGGQGAGLQILGELHAAQQGPVAVHGEVGEEVLVVPAHIPDGHPGVEIGLGGHIGHVAPAGDTDGTAVKQHFAGGGLDQPRGHLHPGGFSASVGAEHGIDVAGLQGQGYMVNGGLGAENLGEFFAFKHGFLPPPESCGRLPRGKRPGCLTGL